MSIYLCGQTDKMGMLHRQTIADICADKQISIDTMRKRWARAGMSRTFARTNVPSDIELIRLNLEQVAKPKAVPKAKAVVIEPVETPHSKIVAPRTYLLFLPFICATVASAANMYLICLHLCDGDAISALVLTALFSGSALVFITAGASQGWGLAVIYMLLAFECFCNAVGVYHGLLGRTSTPTRFLGMVTDIFESGTHGTAIALGVAMSGLICAVQIVSIKTIIRV